MVEPAANAPKTFLGIETSCDETAAAVVQRLPDGTGVVLGRAVHSQIAEHTPFGGVVPELAARAHVEKLPVVIDQALAAADVSLADLDGIAVTAGPGLIGGLIAGVSHARGLALGSRLPLHAVNHLEGHALSPALIPGVAYPYLLLLVSGGHTQIIGVNGPGRYARWGTTIDDALGEAFDKTAKFLGLGFPGGPAVERAADLGDPQRFRFPVALKGDRTLNFSFSGLKTAVRQQAERLAPLGDTDLSDLCAGFQEAVKAALVDRIDAALTRYASETGSPPRLVAAGGVAANGTLRDALEQLARNHGGEFAAPPLWLCGDNGAMIAWAALERQAAGLANAMPEGGARPRWPLDPEAEPMLGSGKRGAKA